MTRQRQQQQALVALIDGAPAKIQPSWLRDPEFAAEYRKALSARFERALGRLQLLSDAAIDSLEQVMRDGSGRGSMARVRAAREILDLGQVAERRDIMRRLDAVERRLGISQTGVRRVS